MRAVIASALLGFLVPVAAIMGYNYWQDPFRFYHFAASASFSENARWQNPGLLKHTEYDTVLIGTSRFANFRPSMFEPEWRVLKVTAPGAMAKEQLATLEYALALGRTRRVVMEASYVSFTATQTGDTADFPEFLYAPSLETPFSYLLSYDLLKRSFGGIFERQHSLDELYVWSHQMGAFGKEAVLETVLKGCSREAVAPLPPAPTAAYLARLERAVAEHPEVEFLLVLPPMHALSLTGGFRDDVRLEAIGQRLNFRSALAKLAARHRHLTLYDYASQPELVLDYRLYSDLGHFRPAINRRIAGELVSATAPRAQLEDINDALLAVRSKVDRTDLPCWLESLTAP